MMTDRPTLESATDTALQVYLLGTVDFEVALALQRRLVYQVSGERDAAALIVCEHTPLVTVGRQGSRAHIHCEPNELAAREWRVRWVNRGGGCWLHLPGQLAVYPILPLSKRNLGVQEYLERLQQVFVTVLGDFTVQARALPGRVGVWAGNRPVVHLGVAVRDWVSYYGAVFNLGPQLDLFRLVHAHGEEPMSSLERERHGPVRHAMIRERLVEHFAQQFGFTRTSLFFDHPALRRKAASNAVATPG